MQFKNQSRLELLPWFSWVHAQFKHDCAISETRAQKLGGEKSWKFLTFLEDFLSWNFSSQSDFVLLSTTFINMASCNERIREIYPGFSDCAIWNFLLQRQLYQPDGSQEQLPHQQHIEAVIQGCFAGLLFFIEHLWSLLLNMKFWHQH